MRSRSCPSSVVAGDVPATARSAGFLSREPQPGRLEGPRLPIGLKRTSVREDVRVDLRLVAAEFESGQLEAERLPAAATSLLAEGHDSSALRRAAGADQAEPEDQRRAFRKALIELGELPITPSEGRFPLVSLVGAPHR